LGVRKPGIPKMGMGMGIPEPGISSSQSVGSGESKMAVLFVRQSNTNAITLPSVPDFAPPSF
jgi:hypothetical protein